MAQISTKSLIFRSKAQMSSDIVEVLNSKKLSLAAKRSVIDNIIWVWSEFDGKYEGCQYWSTKALDNAKKDKKLIHEHLIPRKIIRSQINSLTIPTTQEIILDLFEKHCIGVVITKEENAALDFLKLRSSMPSGWDGADVWVRYKEANISVINTKSGTNVY